VACTLGCSILLNIVLPARAHPGPHHDIERLTAAIALSPDDAALYIERARNYRLDGQVSASLADCDRAASLDGDERAIWLERGLTLAALGRDAEAEAELTQFCESGPPTYEALAERGRIRERSGRNEPALADFTAALGIDGNVQLYLHRGKLQESMGRIEDAAAGYREGLARRRGAAKLRAALLRVEIARQRYDAALALIDESLGRSAVKTHWHLQRAEVFDAAGDKQRAQRERLRSLAEADRVLKKSASSVNLYSRSQVYVALGRVQDAKRDLKRLLDESPHFTAAWELLDRLNKQKGR